MYRAYLYQIWSQYWVVGLLLFLFSCRKLKNIMYASLAFTSILFRKTVCIWYNHTWWQNCFRVYTIEEWQNDSCTFVIMCCFLAWRIILQQISKDFLMLLNRDQPIMLIILPVYYSMLHCSKSPPNMLTVMLDIYLLCPIFCFIYIMLCCRFLRK